MWSEVLRLVNSKAGCLKPNFVLIGLVTQLSPPLFEFLHQLEDKLGEVIKAVGKIDHKFWRSFNTDTKCEPSESFIDGDLIESFLDLSQKDMELVAQSFQVFIRGLPRHCCERIV